MTTSDSASGFCVDRASTLPLKCLIASRYVEMEEEIRGSVSLIIDRRKKGMKDPKPASMNA